MPTRQGTPSACAGKSGRPALEQPAPMCRYHSETCSRFGSAVVDAPPIWLTTAQTTVQVELINPNTSTPIPAVSAEPRLNGLTPPTELAQGRFCAFTTARTAQMSAKTPEAIAETNHKMRLDFIHRGSGLLMQESMDCLRSGRMWKCRLHCFRGDRDAAQSGSRTSPRQDEIQPGDGCHESSDGGTLSL